MQYYLQIYAQCAQLSVGSGRRHSVAHTFDYRSSGRTAERLSRARGAFIPKTHSLRQRRRLHETHSRPAPMRQRRRSGTPPRLCVHAASTHTRAHLRPPALRSNLNYHPSWAVHAYAGHRQITAYTRAASRPPRLRVTPRRGRVGRPNAASRM